MDFVALPPEVNSGRMYAGPGAEPMLAAAAAWDGLAADLHSAAAAYGSVISGLTGGPWLGPASASMAAAAAPYVAWMSATAAQAEQTGAQAKAAASAYEAAFAMTVPPPVIAANRAQLAALVATNFLGQNIPAIMATEAHYSEMWAQDAAAMYGYAGVSAAASTLTPFTPPKPTTNPGGPAGQAAAVAGTHAHTALSSMSAVPQALQSLASPTSTSSGLSPMVMGNGSSLASSGASTPASMLTALSGASGLATPDNAGALGIAEDTAGLGLDGVGLAGLEAPGLVIEALGGPVSEATGAAGLGPMAGLGGLGPIGGLGGLGAGLGGAGASASIGGLGATGASASIGQAASLGALSVPQSWSPLPAIRPVAMELPLTSLSAAPEALTATPGNMFSETALAGMAGRAIGGTATLGRRERTEPPQRPPGSPGSVAELRQLTELLRELAALRDCGILTDEEFNQQKRRLLGH